LFGQTMHNMDLEIFDKLKAHMQMK